jgi:hypothetical protein
VNPHVLVEITFLSERLAAAEDGADKGLFLCVRAKMIKQIVPLLEAPLTIIMFAEEYLSPPLAFGLEIFYVLKCA